jgi:hypothetical protein
MSTAGRLRMNLDTKDVPLSTVRTSSFMSGPRGLGTRFVGDLFDYRTV